MIRVVLLILLVGAQAESERSKAQLDAAQVWEKVLIAKGGKERLNSIQNVLRSSRIPSKLRGQSFDRQLEDLFVLPNKHWHWSDQRPTVFGIRVSATDFDRMQDYLHLPGESPPRKDRPTPDQHRELDLLQAVEMLDSAWLQLRPLRTWSTKNGRAINPVVECEFLLAGSRATAKFTIDSRTMLPSRVLINRVNSSDHILRETYDLENYIDVDGIKMPARIRTTIGGLRFESNNRYRFNVTYDPSVFELGPVIEDGPEGWRNRKRN